MNYNFIYKSFNIGEVKGIDIKVHWSFFILILFFIYLFFDQNVKPFYTFQFTVLFILLFLSVLLHEFGHAIVAKKLGIIPKDIIISALGGLSRLNTMKEHPRKEIIIAFAGPFLNLVIAIIAFLYVIIFTDQYFQISSLDTFLFTDYFGIPFKIAAINLILFLFNLVPAFPMDGGRILRGLFSLKFGYKKATVLASTIGRFIALGFFIIGAINRFYILIFLSGLIYIMAAREGFIHKKRAQ